METQDLDIMVGISPELYQQVKIVAAYLLCLFPDGPLYLVIL